MEMAKLFDKGYHLFKDNLSTSYTAATYLLERDTYMTGTMRRNQMQHLPQEIVVGKPKVGDKIYFRQDEFLAMSYPQKKTQSKPVLMLSTYSGAYDVPHRRKEGVFIAKHCAADISAHGRERVKTL